VMKNGRDHYCPIGRLAKYVLLQVQPDCAMPAWMFVHVDPCYVGSDVISDKTPPCGGSSRVRSMQSRPSISCSSKN